MAMTGFDMLVKLCCYFLMKKYRFRKYCVFNSLLHYFRNQKSDETSRTQTPLRKFSVIFFSFLVFVISLLLKVILRSINPLLTIKFFAFSLKFFLGISVVF